MNPTAPAVPHDLSGRRVPFVCAAVFLAAWTVAAIEPRFPRAWLLENLPLLPALPFLFVLYRRRRLSDRAWVQVTAFLLLHVYGAHYTYANTPIGFWLQSSLELHRNHYDRFVHFAFGLLLVQPLRELLPQPTVRRELFVAAAMIGTLSLAYEQLEWITAVLSDPAAGAAFLGAQGDAWDAQKDATCATLGSLVAVVISYPWRDSGSPARRR